MAAAAAAGKASKTAAAKASASASAPAPATPVPSSQAVRILIDALEDGAALFDRQEMDQVVRASQ